MEASETAPAQPEAAPAEAPAQANEAGVITPEPVEQSESKTPDLSQIGEQIGNLQERFDAQFPKEQEGAGEQSDADLLGGLGFGEQEQADPNDNSDQGVDDFFGLEQPAPQFQSQQEFDQAVEQKALEVLQPYAYQQEMKARASELNKLEEKHPDIGEYADRIKETLGARAQQYGIDPQNLATDPALVESQYKALKADEASSAEVDADGASTAGATLETETGPGSPGSEQDPGEVFAQRFAAMAHGEQKDEFS